MFDETIFEDINSYSAYWVGFLMADGCTTDTNKIQLYISSKDKNHIIKFKEFCKSNNKVIEFNNGWDHCGLSLRSYKVVNDLENFGITRRKSFSSHVNLDLKFNSDFWRGMVDGDGCIQRKSSTNTSTRIGLTGSYQICDQFLAYANQIISTPIKVRVVKNNSVYVIRFNGKQAIELLNDLYKNASIYLNGKYKLANELTNSFKGGF